jgi:predicted RNase H-like nuclease (RuvC/YqgF family)
MSDITHKPEPVAPTVSFVAHADHSAWLQDMEDRRNRAAELEAKRQKVKPKEIKVELSVLDEVLNAVDAAAEDFEQSYGKPNQPLIDAKIETDRLRRELAEAESRLATIEARGDSVQRLKHALDAAEAQIERLRSTAESEEIMRLASDHYGWSIPWYKISSEMKRDFRNHASVIAFKKFLVHASQGVTDPTELRKRLQIVGEKLVTLREYLETSVKTPRFNP